MLTPLTLQVVRSSGGHPILVAVGEIDLSNVETFRQALAGAVCDTTPAGQRVTVDLRAVEYLDSAAISVLCQHAGHIQVSASPLLRSVLNVSGLSELTTVDITSSP